MINRTKEHYENRIAMLMARGESVNANLLRKARRNLKKVEGK